MLKKTLARLESMANLKQDIISVGSTALISKSETHSNPKVVMYMRAGNHVYGEMKIFPAALNVRDSLTATSRSEVILASSSGSTAATVAFPCSLSFPL